MEDIIRSTDSIISDLQPQQVHTFYEAVATIISAETDMSAQNDLVEGLFRLPNAIWDDILLRVATDMTVLGDVEVVKQLCNILKTNLAACRALGNAYMVQLCRIYLDMLNIYRLLSEQINASIATHGEQVVKQPLVRSMRAVKKTVLNLLSCWIQRSHNPVLVRLFSCVRPFGSCYSFSCVERLLDFLCVLQSVGAAQMLRRMRPHLRYFLVLIWYTYWFSLRMHRKIFISS